MVVAGRQKSIAFFIALGAGLISISVLLYVGWVILNWRTGLLLFLGVILLAVIISGVVLNTTFLVREIRRNEQQDAFINAVTHELKTPVASIRLYLQTLQTRHVDEEKRKEFYNIMLQDSERLLNTIEQILRTGRMAATGRRPHRMRLDLGSLLEDCAQRARTLHHLSKEALHYEPVPNLAVLGDAEELQAAVMNLLDNAVKYSRPPVRIRLSAEALSDKHIAIRVTDSGIGIPPSELKQIFKRFYRVPGPFTAKVKGTGLGLYIVRAVAKRHGGKVWAESQGPGSGSTFVLQLPLAS
ncbi:MAG: HAMP domain-containing histidine kinase [Bryobacteraceae bacterium]|nr:HAMP domain-containing histidine kinase [Bryobacteraceae bacterium]MDW8377591.1 HAMP domain-containing sensor histidine kinase [Bryobacterales bacterium]